MNKALLKSNLNNNHLLNARNPMLRSDVLHAIKHVAAMKLQSAACSSKKVEPTKTPKKLCKIC